MSRPRLEDFDDGALAVALAARGVPSAGVGVILARRGRPEVVPLLWELLDTAENPWHRGEENAA